MSIPQLTKIKFSACLECGCRDIGKVQLGTGFGSHTCGEWREFITFRCGSEYEYSPNFSRIICNKPCSREGTVKVKVNVNLQLTLELRKDVDLDNLDLKDVINIPGRDTYDLYSWTNHDRKGLHHPGRVTNVSVVKMKRLKG